MKALRPRALILALMLALPAPALAVGPPEPIFIGFQGNDAARFQMGDSFFDVFTELKVGTTRIDWNSPPEPIRLTSGPQTASADSFFDVFFDVQVSTDRGQNFTNGVILGSALRQRLNLAGPPDPVKSFFDVFFDVSQGAGLPAVELGLEVLFQGTMVLGDGRLVFDASRANMLQLDPPFQAGQFEVIVQQVPEPSALLLMASGLAAAGWLRRRRPPRGRR